MLLSALQLNARITSKTKQKALIQDAYHLNKNPQIKNASIVAPFSGIISAVDVAKGEFNNAGSPVLTLIDNSQWLVETKNVSELDIGKIKTLIGWEPQVPLEETLRRVIAFSAETQ